MPSGSAPGVRPFDTPQRAADAIENDAIAICRGFVDAQHEYALKMREGYDVNQHAQRIVSTPGTQDGLAWQRPEGARDGPVCEAVARAIVVAPIVFAQERRPATTDDLLAEVRLLRADVNLAVLAQVTTARLTLHEGRLTALLQQMASVRRQLSESQLSLAPYTLQLKQAQETNSEILAPLRNMIEQVQKRDQELRTLEVELDRRITSEEQRRSDFNARLDEIERTLATPGR